MTNGTLLHHLPDLFGALKENNIRLYISAYDLPQHKNVETIAGAHGIQVSWLYPKKHWVYYYQGFGNTLVPRASGDAKSSWCSCGARECMQLFDNKLWKCPQVAYLRLLATRYVLNPLWKPTLDYQGLDPKCSDLELASFLERKEEDCCAVCPIHHKILVL